MSSSSSIDSSSNHRSPLPTSAAASSRECQTQIKLDLSTDLRLGLSISPSDSDLISFDSTQIREQKSDWPPIKPLLRSTLAGKSESRRRASLFVKVYMEGIPIGRKLDLFAHDGYGSLISTLAEMFKATILWPGDTNQYHYEKNHHVLTYEDKEGDWMMVGDVPWEMFLSTVRRLKITRANRC